MKKYILSAFLFVSALSFSGCGTNTSTGGVVALGGNTYMITRQSHAGIFADTNKLRQGVIDEAQAYATKQGKSIEVVSAVATPAAEMHWADFSYTFRLVDKK